MNVDYLRIMNFHQRRKEIPRKDAKEEMVCLCALALFSLPARLVKRA